MIIVVKFKEGITACFRGVSTAEEDTNVLRLHGKINPTPKDIPIVSFGFGQFEYWEAIKED